MRKDQNYIRIQNTKMLLDIIIQKRPISRADISKESGMSPTSITRAVSFLIELGLVRETGIYSSGIGRRAVMLDLVADSFYTVGLNIGADSLEMCIINMEYSIVCTQSIAVSVRSFSPEEVAWESFRLLEKLLSGNSLHASRIIGMGICLSGAIDHELGIVSSSPELQWEKVNISNIFKRIFNLPVLVENIIKSSIIGYKSLNQIPPNIDATVLVVDSEVSAASTANYGLIRGRRNAAGYLGHISVASDDLICSCGRTGCLQTYLTKDFLIKRAKVFDETIESIEQILKLSKRNVDWAVNIVNDFQDKLYMALDILTNAYNPSIIFLGGLVIHTFRDIACNLSQKFTSYEYTEIPAEKILIVNQGDNAHILGVAIIASIQFIYLLLAKENNSPYDIQNPNFYL